ncbi:MAG: penicillin-binding transpeptidase domain-containing protein [Acidimicrobiia bacterium]
MAEVKTSRVNVLSAVTLILFSALGMRLWFLQVGGSSAAAARVVANATRTIAIAPPRGRILDVQGRVLAENQLTTVIEVARDVPATERNGLFDRLAVVLDTTRSSIERKWNDAQYSRYRAVPIATDVSTDMVVYIAEHSDQFKYVHVASYPQRVYPYGDIASHVLGYIGRINEGELKLRPGQGYSPDDFIGKYGIEASYETQLRGTAGFDRIEVDRTGQVGRRIAHKDPIPGYDVKLHIDIGLQKGLEEDLDTAITVARASEDRELGGTYAADGGAVVVYDAESGAIDAIASNPVFDPADFVRGISTAEFNTKYGDANKDTNHAPMLNRATEAGYSPGSTFKLITAVAAMSDPISPLDPKELRPSPRYVEYGGREFRFYNDGKVAHGNIDLATALTVSSDTYFYVLGKEFWDEGIANGGGDGDWSKGEQLQQTARSFGFGSPSLVDVPQDGAGLVPDAKWQAETAKVNGTNPAWLGGYNVQIAVGQYEMRSTPLQLAVAYGTFANGGKRYAPQLAAALVENGDTVVRRYAPRVLGAVDVPKKFSDPVIEGLTGVVQNGNGTAAPAFRGFPFAQFPVWGKTGTIQKAGKQPAASFAGVITIDGKQKVVVAYLEQAGYGGYIAAPLVRRVMERLAGIEDLTTIRFVRGSGTGY